MRDERSTVMESVGLLVVRLFSQNPSSYYAVSAIANLDVESVFIPSSSRRRPKVRSNELSNELCEEMLTSTQNNICGKYGAKVFICTQL